jgi:hypothetical protein
MCSCRKKPIGVSLCCDGVRCGLSIALGEKLDRFKLPQDGVDLRARQSGRGCNPDGHQRQDGRNGHPTDGEHITGVDDALAQKIELVIGGDDQVGMRARVRESTLKSVDGPRMLIAAVTESLMLNMFYAIRFRVLKSCPSKNWSSQAGLNHAR